MFLYHLQKTFFLAHYFLISFTDKVLIKTIIEKVLMNADGQSPEVSGANVIMQGLRRKKIHILIKWVVHLHACFIQICAHCFYIYVVLQYCWIKPAATEPQRASGPTRRALPCAVRGKATFRISMFMHFFLFLTKLYPFVRQISVVVTTQSAHKENIFDLFSFINIGKGFCLSTSSGSYDDHVLWL